MWETERLQPGSQGRGSRLLGGFRRSRRARFFYNPARKVSGVVTEYFRLPV